MGSIQMSKSNQSLAIFQPFKSSKYFKNLLTGQLLSLFGSSISMVILPVIVLELTNSTAKMGTILALYMLPNVMMLPFSGIFADKFNKVRIMLSVDIIRCGIMTFLAIAAFMDTISMGSLYLFMFIMGLMDGIFQPAYSSVRAKVFTNDIRTAANSITQVGQEGIRIFGPIIGGILITSSSSGWGFGIDALTYLISFLFLLCMRSLNFQHSSNTSYTFSITNDFLEGINVLKQRSWLWITIVAFSIINICTCGIIRVLIPWLITVHHHMEPYVYGLVLSSSGAGAILCGIIYGSKKKWRYRGILAYTGIAISGLTLFLTSFFSNIPTLMLLMFLNGAGTMLFGLIWEISLQEFVPEEKFGRVASLDMLGSFALLPIGYLLSGWMAEEIGGVLTLIILSSFVVLISISIIMVKGIRDYD